VQAATTLFEHTIQKNKPMLSVELVVRDNAIVTLRPNMEDLEQAFSEPFVRMIVAVREMGILRQVHLDLLVQ
jgi:hypothetical protein|tara:strand:- start:49 stop:264 length:216 start_codon:yes stop_codon:yes gene_type:complete